MLKKQVGGSQEYTFPLLFTGLIEKDILEMLSNFRNLYELDELR